MTIEAATRRHGESIGAWYWRRGVATDDWFLEDRSALAAPIPPLTKVYPDLELRPLPYEPLEDLGAAKDVLSLPRGQPAAAPPHRLDVDDDASLSRFLLASFGLVRHELGRRSTYPYHRPAPSARCRFPTQLYVLLPATKDREQGLYYFDALHHALAPVAVGAGLDDLGFDERRCERDGRLPQAAFVMTSLLWITACTYQHYAYRLCTQEVGLVLGNLEVVAAAHGLVSRPVHHFDAERVAGALRLPVEQETPLAGLMAWGDDAPLWQPGLGTAQEPLDYFGREGFDAEHCRAVLVTDRHVRAARPHRPESSAARWPNHGRAPSARDSEELRDGPAARHGGAQSMGLIAALRERNSGGQTFVPRPEPLERATLEWVLACARSQDSEPACGANVKLLLVANKVNGIASGAHGWEPEAGTFEELRLGDVADGLDNVIAAVPSVPTRAIPAAIFVVADYRSGAAEWGDAALAVLSAEAGAVVQRMMLAAAARELSVRVLNAFRPSAFRELTGVEDEHVGPLFSLFLGRRTPGSTLEFDLP